MGLEILTDTGQVQQKPKESSKGSPTMRKFGTFFYSFPKNSLAKMFFNNKISLQTSETNLRILLGGKDEMLFFKMPSWSLSSQ